MFKRGFKSRMKGLVTSFPEWFYILKAFTYRYMGWKVFCFHCQFTNRYHRTRNSYILNSQNIFSGMQAVILQKLIPQEFFSVCQKFIQASGKRYTGFVGFRYYPKLPHSLSLSQKKNQKRGAFSHGRRKKRGSIQSWWQWKQETGSSRN